MDRLALLAELVAPHLAHCLRSAVAFEIFVEREGLPADLSPMWRAATADAPECVADALPGYRGVPLDESAFAGAVTQDDLKGCSRASFMRVLRRVRERLADEPAGPTMTRFPSRPPSAPLDVLDALGEFESGRFMLLRQLEARKDWLRVLDAALRVCLGQDPGPFPRVAMPRTTVAERWEMLLESMAEESVPVSKLREARETGNSRPSDFVLRPQRRDLDSVIETLRDPRDSDLPNFERSAFAKRTTAEDYARLLSGFLADGNLKLFGPVHGLYSKERKRLHEAADGLGLATYSLGQDDGAVGRFVYVEKRGGPREDGGDSFTAAAGQ
ncbi:hypothetical protein DFJ74DRAFT_771645, partial [Hyaloraphidium curvatum]